MARPGYAARVACATSATHPRREHDPLGTGAGASRHPRADQGDRGGDASRRWLGRERLKAPPARESELTLVHAPAHVSAIRELCAAGGRLTLTRRWRGLVPGGLVRSRRRACAMVGAPLAADASAGFCAMRTSGQSLRARARDGLSACSTDVAIAAELAIRELGVERIMIIGWTSTTATGPPRPSADAPMCCSRASTRPGCPRHRRDHRRRLGRRPATRST